MTTNATNQLTLIDLAKRTDPSGMLADIVELLNAQNDMLDDIPWYEANETTSHLVTVRTSLPAGTYRSYNEGITGSKSTTAQYRETLSMLEDYSKVDKALMATKPDQAAYRKSEDAGFLEGMAQTTMNTLLYGNTATNYKAFTGIMPRYNALSGIENAEQIIDCSGSSTDNTSILLVGWGEKTVHGLYPRAQIGGLQARDLGEDTLVDDNGREYQGYRTHFKWDAGLAIEDWRYIARAANIDVSDLAGAGSSGYSGADLINIMIDLMMRIPKLNASGIKPAFYMNRRVHAALHKLALTKAAGGLTVRELESGSWIMTFEGIPLRRVDSMLNNEDRVV